MATTFTTNFNSGFATWTNVVGAVNAPIGEEGTPCYSCSFRDAGIPASIYKDLSEQFEGTVKFQFANLPGTQNDGLQTPGGPYASPLIANTESPYLFSVTRPTSGGGNRIGIQVYVIRDDADPANGQFMVNSTRGGQTSGPVFCGPSPLTGEWVYVSDVITNLNDGNWKGAQLTWVYDFGAQTLAVTMHVDNVLVLTFTMTTVGTNGNSGGGCAPQDMENLGATRFFLNQWGPEDEHGHGVIENYTIDSVAQVFDWTGMENARQLTPTSCATPSIDDEVVSCPRTITVNGTNLLNYYSFTVTSPGGDDLNYDVDSWTDEELVFTLTSDDLTAGTYVIEFNTGWKVYVVVSCAGETFPMCRRRRFPLPFNQNLLITIYRIEFLIQSGVSPDAIMTARFSRDGGNTWPLTRSLTAGALGAFGWRVYTTNLGQGRNWVCELSTSEPYFWALIQCYAEIEQGTS